MLAVRSTTDDDLDAVVDLWRRFGGPTRSPGQHDEARGLLRRDPNALIVAMASDASIVGSVIVGWDGWRCHMYRLVVHPEQRRNGVATMLLAEARLRAKAVGAARIDAMVHRENGGAVAFWESSGFTLQDDGGRWSLGI